MPLFAPLIPSSSPGRSAAAVAMLRLIASAAAMCVATVLPSLVLASRNSAASSSLDFPVCPSIWPWATSLALSPFASQPIACSCTLIAVCSRA